MATALPLAMPSGAGVDLDVAPLDWNDFTAEERADIEQSLSNIAAGRARLVPHAEVQQAIEEMRRQDR